MNDSTRDTVPPDPINPCPEQELKSAAAALRDCMGQMLRLTGDLAYCSAQLGAALVRLSSAVETSTGSKLQ